MYASCASFGKLTLIVHQEIALKTKELVGNISSLRRKREDGVYVTLEDIQQKKLPQNMDKFLFKVAIAGEYQHTLAWHSSLLIFGLFVEGMTKK